MNAHLNLPKFNHKGDVYLLMKRDRISQIKLFQLNIQRRKSSQKEKINDAQNSLIHPPTMNPSNQRSKNYKNDPKHKILRKDSQISILQDFQQSSKEPSRKTDSEKEKQYVINVSTCPESNSLQVQKAQTYNKKSSLNQMNHNDSMKLQILGEYKNFKAFFQYILDFKLMNIESYNSRKHDTFICKLQQSISTQSKRLSNSLTVHSSDKEADKNIIKSHQTKAQINEYKQVRNRDIQTSQISLVDVRISTASIDDFNPIFKNSNKKINLTSSNQMKKHKKVYFDFQNPHLGQSDDPQQANPMFQSQNNVNTLYKSQSKIVSLDQLKKRIQISQQQIINYTHHGYFCDECKVDPIMGKRYRCIECDQYDLCQKCYKKQCEKFGKIMKNYQNHDPGAPKHKMSYLFQKKPMLKKQMSDILEQQILSQNYSSQENLRFSSQQEIDEQSDHIHLMQQVHRIRPKHQINLEKILKQTNKCSLKCISDKNMNTNQQNIKVDSSFMLSNNNNKRYNLVKSVKTMKQRLAFSQRSIQIKFTQTSHKKLLQSKRKQLENLKKSSQSIINLFK